MKGHWNYIVVLFIILYGFEVKAQPFTMEAEEPITMSMTPIMNKQSLADTAISLKMLEIDEEYNVNIISHVFKKLSYGLAFRIEDGVPSDRSMTFFRDLSFFDIQWNYEQKDFNFGISISNFFNFSDSEVAIEPYLERRSLVAEELYFNHESTAMINASVSYRF